LRQYRALVEEIDGLAFAVDDRGKFALATEPFAEAVGFDRAELIGRDVSVVDTGILTELLRDVSAQKSDSSPAETVVKEGALQTKDGGEFPVRVRGSPVSTDAFDGTVVAANDITELLSAREAAERTQDRFGGLFDALRDPVVELVVPDGSDPGGAELQRSNENFDELFDESEAGVPTGTLDDLSLHDEVADHLSDAARRAQASGAGDRARLTLEIDQRRRHFVVRDVPYEIDGTVHSFVIFTEVTALKRRETHTAVLTRILRHNLRNEISVVSGFVDQIERIAESDGVQSATERIQEASDHLISLSETAGVIQNILEDDDPPREPVDLGAAIDKAVSQTLSRNPDATVELDTTAAGTIEATEYLEHALTELVDNAVSHNPADDPSVTVRVTQDESATTVIVGDDGPPIPEVEWNVVTDQQEITQLQHGSGIGLWLVKWVVDANGGSLNLLKNDDEGTEIAVTLPHNGNQSAAVVDGDRWTGVSEE
ncbi:MAG: ATP-binding protein, partial [Halobaculum sp.]